MNTVLVVNTLIQLHQTIQSKGGYDPKAVQTSTCPLKDLPGFDSLLVPVVFRRLARALEITLPTNYRVPNIYVG
jgi:hypothetical protein